MAVYHLACRKCALSDLAGIPALIDQAKLMDPPQATVAVLDGTNIGPAQPRRHGDVTVNTLWGELAWQLGKAEGYALVREADQSGTSPGKEVLRSLIVAAAPCVILVDELVAYIRQFGPGEKLTGGTYDSNLSFIQALTEAVKLVPNAILLASLPILLVGGFLTAAICGYMAGLIGSSNSPISGVGILAVTGTALLLALIAPDADRRTLTAIALFVTARDH